MGIGLHGGGVATVRFFAEAGAKVIATDMKSEEELQPSLEKLKDLKNVSFVLGQHRMENFTAVGMVVKGPSVPWNSKHVQEAIKRKIPVEMDSSLFFKMCRLPIIGVTGTKGKTTTATLIAEVLKEAGKKVFTAGIGQEPVLNVLDEVGTGKEGTVIFELSSWRLSALGREKLSPHVGVVTNILPDHLNYYGTMEKYVADKKYIFENQNEKDFAVLNYDNEAARVLAKGAKSKKVFFTANAKIDFSDDFVGVREGKIFWRRDEEEKVVCDINDVKLRGGHNLYNVLAAVSSTSAIGIDAENICEGVKKFKGVRHRLELVRELEGVKYVNDTAATVPDAALSGIASFSEPIVLIAGGADKKLNFAKFAKVISEKVKKVILLKGEATEKIKKELGSLGEPSSLKIDCEFDSMEKAVIRAKNISGPGDVVLLSPGAASFGLFANEFDRGEKFREAVEKLK